MGLDTHITLLTNNSTSKNFHNLANDLGDILFLLETIYLYQNKYTLVPSNVIKVLDTCASEIDFILREAEKIASENIEKSIIRSINLIEELN